MNRIAFLFLAFLALGVFAVVSLFLTVLAWASPSVEKPPRKRKPVMSLLKDDDPVVLNWG